MADFRERLQKYTAKLPPRGTLFRIFTISAIVLLSATVAVAAYVYYQAVKTFEIRRVSLPTRIFADAFPLKPGTGLQPDDLVERLSRLGYREAPNVSQPGEYNRQGSTFDIHLRAFQHPAGNREAQRVRVALASNEITSVTQAGSDSPVEGAALEPELLTSILSDQLENRRPVTLDQIPQHLIDAVVVTEDVRFWQHPGVDPIGIFRALFRNLRAKGVAEGGSTLTQQLVKNYYLTNERTVRRKVVEAFMSLILDAKYSKREILGAYLNDIYLGRNRSISILGVGEAARFYFGKPVSEISVAEAAMIAGMIRSPNNNSPFANAERAKQRRDTVLLAMRRNDKIDEATYQKALQEKLPTKPFRSRSGLTSIPFYVDRVLQELEIDYGIDDVQGRGLAIYTSIDLEWQDAAARSLETGLRNLEKSSRRLRRSENPLEGVIIAVDVGTGEIRALVGGRNYDRSQFNRALQAKRQVGSLYKPFVYLAAFEPSLSKQNITPATLVNDNRFTLERRYGKDWSPKNYGDQYYGIVTVRRALEQSMNVASVRIGLSTGIAAVNKTANVLGVQTELEEVPSIILGSVEIPPIEMAEAYTTMARIGNRVPLHSIRYVTSEGGRVLATGNEVQGVQVFPARGVYLAVNLMQGVMNRGTAAGSRSLGFRKKAAGKTGTTNDKRDAWFIGFTPQTLALTWIGFDDNAPVGISGSDGAVPIWTRYMRQITGGQRDGDFPVPQGIVFTPIDAMTGGLATPLCPAGQVVNEAFKSGTQPGGLCRLHNPQMPPPVDPMLTDTAMQAMPVDPTILPPGGLTTIPSPDAPLQRDVEPPAAPPAPTETTATSSPPTTTQAIPPPTTTSTPPPTSPNDRY